MIDVAFPEPAKKTGEGGRNGSGTTTKNHLTKKRIRWSSLGLSLGESGQCNRLSFNDFMCVWSFEAVFGAVVSRIRGAESCLCSPMK